MAKNQSPTSEISPTSNVALIICQEEIRLRGVRDKLLAEKELIGVTREVFYGEELNIKTIPSIRDLLHSNSLFSPKQLIEIKRADSIKAAVLDHVLKLPMEDLGGNFLLLTARNLKANSRLKKHFKKQEALIEIPALKENELPKWASQHSKEYGIKLTQETATLLVHIGENNPDRIDKLIQHLALYTDESTPTAGTILKLFESHPDPNEFALLEKAIMGKKPTDAEQLLTELLEQGKNEFLLLNLLGKTLSRLLHIRILLEQRLSQGEIQSKVAGPPWLIQKQIGLAKQLSSAQFEMLLEKVVLADSRLKNKSLGAPHILSDLLKSIPRKPLSRQNESRSSGAYR